MPEQHVYMLFTYERHGQICSLMVSAEALADPDTEGVTDFIARADDITHLNPPGGCTVTIETPRHTVLPEYWVNGD